MLKMAVERQRLEQSTILGSCDWISALLLLNAAVIVHYQTCAAENDNHVGKYLISDPQGYIAYCPCMGRLGNQVDQFLGALAFAKAINRTLLLSPWVEYRAGQPGSTRVPFSTYFKVAGLLAYHRVMPLEDFMESLAESEWPPQRRIAFCYRSRRLAKATAGASSDNIGDPDCAPKEGNPFGPFWDSFGIDFVASETFSPLYYETTDLNIADDWQHRFPSAEYRVLAFTGTPGAFPVQKHNLRLQKYLQFSDDINLKVRNFIHDVRMSHAGPFVGIHLRNGLDWKKACDIVKDAPLLFSAPQCFGYSGELANPSFEHRKRMCFPTRQDICDQVVEAVRHVKARWVFVASDNDHLLPEINHALRSRAGKTGDTSLDNVFVVRLPLREDNRAPVIDLATLSRANMFIGNCFSSFSAFVKRQRDVDGLESVFWGFSKFTTQNFTTDSSQIHDEL